MEQYYVKKIGVVRADEEGMRVQLEKEYAPALTGLDGFGHVIVLWWFSECDSAEARSKLTEAAPYKGAPALMGTFAMRSPCKPNPIAVSCAEVTYIDRQNAVIGLAYIDAEDGTPVLDIKPYTPSLDRVEHPAMPAWCEHWPKNCETSGDFDWESVFNF